jgi:two-component system response regulator YesN
MDGIALIKAVKEYGIDVKFVIISAYEEFEYARQAVSLGVLEYLVKPITLEEAKDVWDKIRETGKKPLQGQNGKLKDDYPQAHPLVQKALDLIECSYGTRISQKDMAEKLGISAEYFSFLFSRDVKENFSKFLRKYRIEKARQMIDKGELSCEQIAYSVGFSDMKYFYKCFKDEIGMNVSEYKRANC